MSSEKGRIKSVRFKKRYIIPSNEHDLIGRIFSLSIVEYEFEEYEEISRFVDTRYVFHINYWLSAMVARIESLNRVADMLWLDSQFLGDSPIPISRYDWANIASDAFLMRFISVSDAALILTNEVCECGLDERKCTLNALKRKKVPEDIIKALENLIASQSELRSERNVRFHHGIERQLSSDDLSFRTVSISEHRGLEMKGRDINGNTIDTARYLKEALVNLQEQFNASNRLLSKSLNELFDLLQEEFEGRFRVKFHDPERGYGRIVRKRS